MSTRDNAPPPDGWRCDPHDDGLEAYVWLDSLTIDERRARIDWALAGLAAINWATHGDEIPDNVILGAD